MSVYKLPNTFVYDKLESFRNRKKKRTIIADFKYHEVI